MIDMIYCGIDPGVDGALAFINPDSGHPDALPRIIDMPVVKFKSRREYDPQALASIFETYRNLSALHQLIVGMEALHAMPAFKCGGVTNFSLGRASGLFEGILASFKIPYQKIPPQRWKKAMLDGMPAGKGASIIVAHRLFPEVELKRKKDHGRADALLIAEFLRRTYRPNWDSSFTTFD